MADQKKAKAAKDRLTAAKKAAEEAELADVAPESTPESKAEPAPESIKADGDSSADHKVDEAPPDIDKRSATPEDLAKVAGGAALAMTAGKDDAPAPDDGRKAAENSAPETPDETPPEPDEAVAVAEDEPAPDPEPAPEPTPEHAQEPDEHEPRAEAHDEHVPMAATILKYLAVLVVGGAAALWAGPRIAPNLPAWAAPVATFLTPGTDIATEKVATLSADIEAKLAALGERVDAAGGDAAKASSAAGDAVAAAEARATKLQEDLKAQLDALAAEPRADLSRLEGLAKRLTAAEAAMTGLKTEVEQLAGFSPGDASPSAETLERVAAFGAAVEGLRAEVTALSARAAEVEAAASASDVQALTARVAALEGGEAATSGARAEATDIRRSAEIDAALTGVDQALLSGAPYADALERLAELSDEVAPEGLVATASSGAPTQDSLLRRFPVAAQDAYSAALIDDAGAGAASQLLATLQGRLGGRPAMETAGDDPGAVLSRVEARLKAGRLVDARAEAEGLSEASRAAMAGWLAALDNAIAASEGAAAYRDALKSK